MSTSIDEVSLAILAVVALSWPIAFGLYALIGTRIVRDNDLKEATDGFAGAIDRLRSATSR